MLHIVVKQMYFDSYLMVNRLALKSLFVAALMHPVPLALAHARDMAQQSNVHSSKNEHTMLLTTTQ